MLPLIHVPIGAKMITQKQSVHDHLNQFNQMFFSTIWKTIPNPAKINYYFLSSKKNYELDPQQQHVGNHSHSFPEECVWSQCQS